MEKFMALDAGGHPEDDFGVCIVATDRDGFRLRIGAMLVDSRTLGEVALVERIEERKGA